MSSSPIVTMSLFSPWLTCTEISSGHSYRPSGYFCEHEPSSSSGLLSSATGRGETNVSRIGVEPKFACDAGATLCLIISVQFSRPPTYLDVLAAAVSHGGQEYGSEHLVRRCAVSLRRVPTSSAPSSPGVTRLSTPSPMSG